MKKLSKIVALLLAGALTMLLFTACGGVVAELDCLCSLAAVAVMAWLPK